jgi:hypothetical protein
VARAQFNVKIELAGVAKLLTSAAHCEPIEPVRAVLHSEGAGKLGGGTQELRLEGSYSFTPQNIAGVSTSVR